MSITATGVLFANGFTPEQLRNALYEKEDSLRKFTCTCCKKEISSKSGYTNLVNHSATCMKEDWLKDIKQFFRNKLLAAPTALDGYVKKKFFKSNEHIWMA
jgi:hypothetical protein